MASLVFNPFTGRLDYVGSGGSATPGGADTQVQFNDGGAFAGNAGFIFDKTSGAVKIGGAGFGTEKLWVQHTAGNTSFATFEGFLTVTPTANTAANYFGNFYFVQKTGAFNTTGNIIGMYGQAFNGGSGGTSTRIDGVRGNGYQLGSTTTLITGVSGNVTVQGGTATTAVGLYAAPFTSFGGTITTAYGAKIDPPGVGTTAFTLAAGNGSSYVAGRLHVGLATDSNETTLKITQPAGEGAGGLSAFKVVAAAHQNNGNADFNDVYFDLDRTVNFTGAGADFDVANFRIDLPEYTADAAQTINNAFGLYISNLPRASTNIGLNVATALAVVLENQTSAAASAVNVVIGRIGIDHGMGNVNIRSNVFLLGDSVTLGNQTATLGEFSGLHIGAATLISDTNVRTVTVGASLYIEGAPVNGGNTMFTNGPYALYVDSGDFRTDGNILMAGATSGFLTFAVPAIVTSHTLTWPSTQGAAGSVLSNDGAGSLSWVAPGASAGGWTDDGANVRLTTATDFVGVGTALPDAKLHIVQNNATTGVPLALHLVTGAHTGLNNANYTESELDHTSNVQFTGGGADIEEVASVYIDMEGKTYSAAAAQNINLAVGTWITGAPKAGTNVTFGALVNFAVLGGISGSAAENYTAAISHMGIAEGVGNVDRTTGIFISEDNVNLGNQTATLAEAYGVLLGSATYESTTNTRTVTNAATMLIQGPPIAGVNVTFTNPVYSLRVASGSSRFDGRVLTGKGANVASANDLTLGADGNYFVITGTTQINAITTANWTAGTLIYLEFAGALTIKHNTAGGAGTAAILLENSSDFLTQAGSVVKLVYNGTNWIGSSFMTP